MVAQDKLLIDSLYKQYNSEKDPKNRIELLYKIADEVEETGKPEEIVRYADSLELLAKAAKYPKGLARAYEIHGRYYEKKGEHVRALPYYQKQLSLLVSVADKEGQARALTNIGNMWHELASNDSAVVNHIRAMRIMEELGKKSDVAVSLANIANAYSDLEAYDKAIEMLKQSLE